MSKLSRAQGEGAHRSDDPFGSGLCPAPFLLVEDDPGDAELAIIALASAGLPNLVTRLGDGAQALDYLLARGEYSNRPSGLPALVILDLALPKVDGIEVLATIRARPQLRPLPVIILTSSPADRQRIEALQLGANGYFVKTASFDGLAAMARRLSSSPTEAGSTAAR